LDDKLGISWSTVTLGEVLNMQGDLKNAKTMIDEGLTLARQQEEPQAIGWALSHLGNNSLLQGDFDQAQNYYSESGNVFRSLGPHKAGVGWAHFGLGEAALAKDEVGLATENLKLAVKSFNEYKNRLGIAWCISSLAAAASLMNQDEQAAQLWAIAEAIHDRKGVREPPIIKELHEKLRAKVRAQLGEGKFKSIGIEKQSTSLEQAVSEALAL